MASRRHRVTRPSSPIVGSQALGGKLRAPERSDPYVRRARLHKLLDEDIRAPITVITAPAGAGKTALLAGWIAESAIPVAWLTLDETNQDPAWLWSNIISALETVTPECGIRARAVLSQVGMLFHVVDRLVEDLELLQIDPTVLIIDDLHYASDQEVVSASLTRFVEQIPPALHVILASRRRPNLPLDRLRARGRLREVHFAELRLSLSEAAEMLSGLVGSLPPERVVATIERVQGWPAGLQLVALAAQSEGALEGAQSLSIGADVLIHDFVCHEVLANEDPLLVRVLLDIAVVERVDTSLAQALTARSDAGDLLLRAEERGLFVSRLGSEGWFEIHALVRSALLGELSRTSPERLLHQHAVAAQWFEEAEEVSSALEHWLLANQPRRALRLLANKQWDIYTASREGTLRRTIASIPIATSTADLDSMLEYAWCHVLISRRRFLELVEQMSWWIKRSGAEGDFHCRVTMLRSIAETVRGQWVVGGALAREVLENTGESWWTDPVCRFAWNVVANEIALNERWDNNSDQVRQAELAVCRDAALHMAFEGSRALGCAMAGRPVDALRVVDAVMPAIANQKMTFLATNLVTELSTAEALAHREIGDHVRAKVELLALADSPLESMSFCRFIAILELVAIEIENGDLDAAQRLFAQAEILETTDLPGADGRQWLAQVGTKLALAANHLDSAWHWSTQIHDEFWGPISAARLRLAVHDRDAAAAKLTAAKPRSVRHDVMLKLFQARCTSDRDDASLLVGSAIEIAAEYGLLQTVISEGLELTELFERVAWRAPHLWMERLRRSASSRQCSDSLISTDALTDRERDVARFLTSRLTHAEIARELFISVNTLQIPSEGHLPKAGRQFAGRSCRSD